MLGNAIMRTMSKPTLATVPIAVQEASLRLLKDTAAQACGTTRVIDNWFVETHTLGCRNAADTAEEDWWDEHYRIYEDYKKDAVSLVLGDPSDGRFVTITRMTDART